MPDPRIAIVDYGMGNLYSVRHACEAVGAQAIITSDPDVVGRAEAVILPGVGAFAQAMESLQARGMVTALRDFAASGRPLLGVCLGQQLLMTESFEFGRHKGLDLVPGVVDRLPSPEAHPVKVPQVGWNQIRPARPGAWAGTPLEGTREGEYVYFVHSFYTKPRDPSVAIAVTTYGGVEFCSAMRKGNVFAWQFHPERSGAAGLAMYRRFSAAVTNATPIT